jgi:hypothetical protein
MSPRALNAQSLAEIEAELCVLHASIESSRSRMLTLVDGVDADGSWVLSGATSTVDWLCKLLDIEAGTAREHVRIARALRDLPATAVALADGTLSYSKAKALTRVATPENEDELLALVAQHPAASLPATLALWQQREDPDAARRRQIVERSMTVRTDVSGNHVITIVLPPEQAAGLEALIDAELLAHLTCDARTPLSPPGRRGLSAKRPRPCSRCCAWSGPGFAATPRPSGASPHTHRDAGAGSSRGGGLAPVTLC